MGCSNSKTSPEEDSGMQDIETTRGCTDIIWIPIFAVFWIGMVTIAIIGFNMDRWLKKEAIKKSINYKYLSRRCKRMMLD